MDAATVHPFERSGLGKAPYRFRKIEDTGSTDSMGLRTVGQVDGYHVHTTPGGTCEHCGTAIIVKAHFVSADGHQFHVGIDCAEKAYQKVDRFDAAKAALKKAVSKRRAAQRKAREVTKLEELQTLIDDNEDFYATLPHPRGFTNRETGAPLTMLDQINWTMKRAGTKGKLALLKTLKAL